MKRIKELRQAKGLRQVDMAAHFGVAQATVVKWESEGLYLRPDCCRKSQSISAARWKISTKTKRRLSNGGEIRNYG